MAKFEVPERLYVTLDGDVVKEGDPAARNLLFPKGRMITEAEALRYGLLDGDGEPDEAADGEPVSGLTITTSESKSPKPATKKGGK